MAHAHHNGDGHHHPTRTDQPPSEYEHLENVVRELLIEKGIITAEEVRAAVEKMENTTPERGARLVARAWIDPPFKERLLADANAAAEELGIVMASENLPADLIAVENRPGLHNMVVCTLCSCYPRLLLGLPPDWYKSRPYRSRAVREPRKVLAEFGTVLPGDTEVRVHDSNADMRYMVVPMRPDGTGHLDEDQLASLVTRDCMIGVTVPRAPAG